jgi:hypothetical protein
MGGIILERVQMLCAVSAMSTQFASIRGVGDDFFIKGQEWRQRNSQTSSVFSTITGRKGLCLAMNRALVSDLDSEKRFLGEHQVSQGGQMDEGHARRRTRRLWIWVEDGTLPESCACNQAKNPFNLA